MIALPAYFDGNTVRTVDAYQFHKNQKLVITVLDDTETQKAIGNTQAEKAEKLRALYAIAGILSDNEAAEMRRHCHLHFRELEA